MAQWINALWNNSFINLMQLSLLCRYFRAVALAEPGLMAGRLAGWLIDKIRVNFEYLKIIIDRFLNLLLHLTKLQHY